MLQTHDLRFAYAGAEALHFPDLQLSAGGQALILGHSGTGKTTLLHLIAGLLRPSGGEVKIAGTDIFTLSAARRDRFRGQHVGLVFQQPRLLQALSVRENLALAQKIAGQKKAPERIENLLGRLQMRHRADAKPQQLSAGEAQRVGLARALVNRPALLLADEPTSALDDQNARRVIQLLQEAAAEDRAALLVVTHDQRIKALFEKKYELQNAKKTPG